MKPDFAPLRFLLLAFAGWVNHEQQAAIDYLREENAWGENAWGRRAHLSA